MTITDEEAFELVTEIFRSLGGNVIPPRRPNHKDDILTPERDSFMMDFENECLRSTWTGEFPKGPKRHEHCAWAVMIQSQVLPHHSDVDWEEYAKWVSSGLGDEFFQGLNGEVTTNL